MRRTALFLGGLFLATGASLALAGPAQAHDGNCKKDHGYAAAAASIDSGVRGDRIGHEDHPDVIIVNNDRYYPGRYYGGYNSSYWLGLGFNFQVGGGGSYYPGYGYGGWGFGAGFGGGFGGGFNAAV